MTWRYSAKHQEVRQGRNLVSEEWLLETLNKMTEEVRYPNYRAEFCRCSRTFRCWPSIFMFSYGESSAVIRDSVTCLTNSRQFFMRLSCY